MCLVLEGISFLPELTRQNMMQFLFWISNVLLSWRRLSSSYKNREGKWVTLKNIFLKPKIRTHTTASDNFGCRQMLSSSLYFPNILSMGYCESVDFLLHHILSVYGVERRCWSQIKVLFIVCSLWRYRKKTNHLLYLKISLYSTQDTYNLCWKLPDELREATHVCFIDNSKCFTQNERARYSLSPTLVKMVWIQEGANANMGTS